MHFFFFFFSYNVLRKCSRWSVGTMRKWTLNVAMRIFRATSIEGRVWSVRNFEGKKSFHKDFLVFLEKDSIFWVICVDSIGIGQVNLVYVVVGIVERRWLLASFIRFYQDRKRNVFQDIIDSSCTHLCCRQSDRWWRILFIRYQTNSQSIYCPR